MDTTLDIQELAIVIVAKNYTPTILSPEFLKYSGIVPADWELATAPVRTSSGAQVTFQNGVNIVAQFGR